MTTPNTDPRIGLAQIRGSDCIFIHHKGRTVEVVISPKGKRVRVHVDGKEWKP